MAVMCVLVVCGGPCSLRCTDLSGLEIRAKELRSWSAGWWDLLLVMPCYVETAVLPTVGWKGPASLTTGLAMALGLASGLALSAGLIGGNLTAMGLQVATELLQPGGGLCTICWVGGDAARTLVRPREDGQRLMSAGSFQNALRQH